MKLAAISMIRDEADIVGTFLRHLAALFDLVFLLDQRSSDGTTRVIREACAGRPGWSHWRMDFAGRHQKEMSTAFMARAFEGGADAVFFIDCDEFVGVHAKAELEAAAAMIDDRAALGVFRWRNCVPQQFDQWRFDPADLLWIAGHDGSVEKIAVPKSLFRSLENLHVTQGSHNAVDSAGNPIRARIALGHFLHVPVRSRQQFLQKIFISAIANLAKNNRMLREGVHKRRYLEVIAEREISDVELASIGAQFPLLAGMPVWWNKPDDLMQAGFARARMDVPFADLALPDPERPKFEQIIARALRDYRIEDVEGGEGTLVFDGDAVRFQARSSKNAAPDACESLD